MLTQLLPGEKGGALDQPRLEARNQLMGVDMLTILSFLILLVTTMLHHTAQDRFPW